MMMARKRKKGLSDRQKKILEVLDRFQVDPGYPPSIREICDATDISSTSVVNYYLDQLQEMGFIERDQHVSRGIRLLIPYAEAVNSTGGAIESISSGIKQTARNLRQAMDELLKIPISGRIVASAPVPVPQSDFGYYDAESMVEVARSLLPGREKGSTDLFALEVSGDSMIDAMVNDGDIVIMKPTKDVRNGEMVAVWLNDRDETTLKYFYLENGHVRLQPANPTMNPIFIEDPSVVEIQGKVVMVIRQVGGLPS
ncbi:MAG TPA: transcriptional repressor LexA [Anaerolineales bacterium]|nr:transcriptional repressor LexA [Anaerolineales bacterium]